VGKVLLAHAPPEVMHGVLAAGLKPYASGTITDPDLLRTDLERVRVLGYSVTRDEMTEGAMSVGAPVHGPDQQVVAALSVVVDSRTGVPERLAAPVRTAARGMGRLVVDLWFRVVPGDGEFAASWDPGQARRSSGQRKP
jgi:DNA-binding IclR family transcriptional regulator